MKGNRRKPWKVVAEGLVGVCSMTVKLEAWLSSLVRIQEAEFKICSVLFCFSLLLELTILDFLRNQTSTEEYSQV